MTSEKKEMLSVVPTRNDTWRTSVLFGPLRYFWLMVLGRRVAPPASSAIWMINRATLSKTLGGFTSEKDEVQPEVRFAAQLGTAYRCLLSDETFGVSYEKKWRSQVETSRRLLYPMSGGTWWKAMIAVCVLLLLNVPLFTLLSAFIFGWDEMQVMALWLLLINMALYATYTSHLWQRKWWLGGLVWPVVIFQELILFIMSMVGYARHTITWKGRLVTALTPTERVVIDE